MKRLIVVLAMAAAVLVAVQAAAASYYGYAGPKYWYPGETGGSYFSSSWRHNHFNKERSGLDTTVTFIDNVSYGWHATVRNTSLVTETSWWTSAAKKAHCRAHSGYFNGGCWVHTS
jgi:hypothetical protein